MGDDDDDKQRGGDERVVVDGKRGILDDDGRTRVYAEVHAPAPDSPASTLTASHFMRIAGDDDDEADDDHDDHDDDDDNDRHSRSLMSVLTYDPSEAIDHRGATQAATVSTPRRTTPTTGTTTPRGNAPTIAGTTPKGTPSRDTPVSQMPKSRTPGSDGNDNENDNGNVNDNDNNVIIIIDNKNNNKNNNLNVVGSDSPPGAATENPSTPRRKRYEGTESVGAATPPRMSVGGDRSVANVGDDDDDDDRAPCPWTPNTHASDAALLRGAAGRKNGGRGRAHMLPSSMSPPLEDTSTTLLPPRQRRGLRTKGSDRSDGGGSDDGNRKQFNLSSYRQLTREERRRLLREVKAVLCEESVVSGANNNSTCATNNLEDLDDDDDFDDMSRSVLEDINSHYDAYSQAYYGRADCATQGSYGADSELVISVFGAADDGTVFSGDDRTLVTTADDRTMYTADDRTAYTTDDHTMYTTDDRTVYTTDTRTVYTADDRTMYTTDTRTMYTADSGAYTSATLEEELRLLQRRRDRSSFLPGIDEAIDNLDEAINGVGGDGEEDEEPTLFGLDACLSCLCDGGRMEAEEEALAEREREWRRQRRRHRREEDERRRREERRDEVRAREDEEDRGKATADEAEGGNGNGYNPGGGLTVRERMNGMLMDAKTPRRNGGAATGEDGTALLPTADDQDREEEDAVAASRTAADGDSATTVIRGATDEGIGVAKTTATPADASNDTVAQDERSAEVPAGDPAAGAALDRDEPTTPRLLPKAMSLIKTPSRLPLMRALSSLSRTRSRTEEEEVVVGDHSPVTPTPSRGRSDGTAKSTRGSRSRSRSSGSKNSARSGKSADGGTAWREYTDPGTGSKYYCDGVDTTWHRPENVEIIPEGPRTPVTSVVVATPSPANERDPETPIASNQLQRSKSNSNPPRSPETPSEGGDVGGHAQERPPRTPEASLEGNNNNQSHHRRSKLNLFSKFRKSTRSFGQADRSAANNGGDGADAGGRRAGVSMRWPSRGRNGGAAEPTANDDGADDDARAVSAPRSSAGGADDAAKAANPSSPDRTEASDLSADPVEENAPSASSSSSCLETPLANIVVNDNDSAYDVSAYNVISHTNRSATAWRDRVLSPHGGTAGEGPTAAAGVNATRWKQHVPSPYDRTTSPGGGRRNRSGGKGWKEYADPATGKKYYSNGYVTTWDRPADFVPSGAAAESAAARDSPSKGRRKKKGWREYADKNTGLKYYSNGVTTTWDRPANFPA